jgi:hypothetical protein
MPEAIDQARKSWPLPEVATTVISADTPLGQWPLKTAQDVAVQQKEQMVLLARISGASHVLVPHSDHMSILRKDEVALEILKILRSSHPQ